MNTVQNGMDAIWLDAENWGGSSVRRIRHRRCCNSDNINSLFQKCGQVPFTCLQNFSHLRGSKVSISVLYIAEN